MRGAPAPLIFIRRKERRSRRFFFVRSIVARTIYHMKKSAKGSKTRKGASARESAAFKIKLRGKDNAPLSMREMRDGLYEAGVARFQPICDVRGISREKGAIFEPSFISVNHLSPQPEYPLRYGKISVFLESFD